MNTLHNTQLRCLQEHWNSRCSKGTSHPLKRPGKLKPVLQQNTSMGCKSIQDSLSQKHLLSMSTSSELLSSCSTWTTSGQGFSVTTHTSGVQTSKWGFSLPRLCPHRLTQAAVGEPGRVGVQVDVFYVDGQAGTRPQRHADAHLRVLLLRRHHHLKHPQGVGQRKVKMLQEQQRKYGNETVPPSIKQRSITSL